MKLGRKTLFIACGALGLLVGVAGERITGSEWWHLAFPGVIAAGWLVVANPEKCTPQVAQGKERKSHAG